MTRVEYGLITFPEFLALAKDLNPKVRGKFTDDELFEYATMYFDEYMYSIDRRKPSLIMIGLCTELVTDMDQGDYKDAPNELDVDTMHIIIRDYMFENDIQA